MEELLAKSKGNGGTTLRDHLEHVAIAAQQLAKAWGWDESLLRRAALLHDIGKASPVFQRRLKEKARDPMAKPFRHELASLCFLPLIEESLWTDLTELVVAHHKSIKGDARRKGLLDLYEEYEDEYKVFDMHTEEWEQWSPIAVGLLASFGDFQNRPISIEQARQAWDYVYDYCKTTHQTLGWSEKRGILMAADEFASAAIHNTAKQIGRSFQKPLLRFYDRTASLYPLSLLPADDLRPHSLVTAPTGAGKTDYLIRRCRGRFFYTLPFQASINAMYRRIEEDLKNDNPDLDIRLLHAASKVILSQDGKEKDIRAVQDKVGAAIKVLTPHQMASMVFGLRGFEALMLDLRGCDIILDEIHSYTDITKAIVLKIVEVLVYLGCKIHIGTATMPTVLYVQLLKLLSGREKVYEIALPHDELDKFDRHIVYKINDWEQAAPIIQAAILEQQKVLIVCNQVQRAQKIYENITEAYPDLPKMLIHSRFMREHRNQKERDLKKIFNEMATACVVVSTQVVEVSLDISFDLMITECAPFDALIQRFGRINRKRSEDTIGKFKPVYVMPPPGNAKDARPYSIETLQRSYEQLPDGEVLHERDLQEKIDIVFTEIDETKIDEHTIFSDGLFKIRSLTHNSKSVFFDLLDIDSVTCITEENKELYLHSFTEKRVMVEIPAHYNSIAHNGLDRIAKEIIGSRPFIVPDKAYSSEYGLDIALCIPQHYNPKYKML